MDLDASAKRSSIRPATEVSLLAVGVVACLLPYLDRLRHPSLYTDDVTRIIQLRVFPLDRLLFLHFNEHMSPLFQLLSWLTWRLAGERLAWAPLAFTLVSFVPFALSLWLLGWLIREETGSTLTALASLAVFGLSWLSSETVYWYSASSFMWALALTLAAWLGAAATGAGRPARGALTMGVATALAPAFSAIGLLAGPLALVRLLAREAREGRRGVRWAGLAPVAGPLAYLAVCWAFRYGDVLSESIERNLHLRAGLIAAVRAPVDILLPGLFGLRSINRHISHAASLILAAIFFLGSLSRARRSPHRALILGGLMLILGGYALTFCARCDDDGHFAMKIGQRYHLFPQLGLALLLAPAFKAGLGRRASRPAVGLLAVLVLAALLAVTHVPAMLSWSRFFRYPDQSRTLAALDRLGTICKASGITRAQALAALDPIEPSWSTAHLNALEMLGPGAGVAKRPDARVRSLLLAALTPADRAALCGGMDASPYLQPFEARGDLATAALGHLEGSYLVRAADDGRWIAAGGRSFLQYAVPATTGPGDVAIRALGLPLDMPGGSIEVWWRGDHDDWSETRSVRCRLERSRAGQGWVIATDRLPHWEPEESRHLRLLFRTPGVAAVGTPRLLR